MYKPTIALINQSTQTLDERLDILAAALQIQVIRDFWPAWGVTCKIVPSDAVIPGAWALYLMDDADTQGALGYHELTPDGLPLGKVFIKTLRQYGEKVSVTASHELLEMLGDPGISQGAQRWANNEFWAYETADAVEDQSYKIGPVLMSNFVFPTFFEDFHKPGATQLDFLRSLQSPFTLTAGGYSSIFVNGAWTERFGSQMKKGAFAQEDRRGHRSEIRKVRMKL